MKVSDELMHIDRKFVDEYVGSVYTAKLRGGVAKAKANAAQGILEMLKIAVLKNVMENKKKRVLHSGHKVKWNF